MAEVKDDDVMFHVLVSMRRNGGIDTKTVPTEHSHEIHPGVVNALCIGALTVATNTIVGRYTNVTTETKDTPHG